MELYLKKGDWGGTNITENRELQSDERREEDKILKEINEEEKEKRRNEKRKQKERKRKEKKRIVK